jgi:hypothetical protein
MKSGKLNYLEPSGPLQACNGIALPLPFYLEVYIKTAVPYLSLSGNYLLLLPNTEKKFKKRKSVLQEQKVCFIYIGHEEYL